MKSSLATNERHIIPRTDMARKLRNRMDVKLEVDEKSSLNSAGLTKYKYLTIKLFYDGTQVASDRVQINKEFKLSGVV